MDNGTAPAADSEQAPKPLEAPFQWKSELAFVCYSSLFSVQATDTEGSRHSGLCQKQISWLQAKFILLGPVLVIAGYGLYIADQRLHGGTRTCLLW